MINDDLTKNIYDSIWPIGRGFIDFTNTDYSNYLGFTWVRELVGLTPVGYNANDTDFNTIGKTGGEKTHTLTVNEMPSHKHGQQVTLDTSTTAGNIRATVAGGGSIWNERDYNQIKNEGGGQAHNNMQPYKVVAYWKRTA